MMENIRCEVVIERSTGIRLTEANKMRLSQKEKLLKEAEERLVLQVARAMFENNIIKFRYRKTDDELVITAVAKVILEGKDYGDGYKI